MSTASTPSPPRKRSSLSRQFQTHAARRAILSGQQANEPKPPDPTSAGANGPLGGQADLRGDDPLGEEKVLALIEDGQPLKLAHAFQSPEYGQVFARLPPAVFVEALRLLSPTYFVEPSKEIQGRLYLRHVPSGVSFLRQTFAEFSRRLSEIVTARRYVGHNIGLAEYAHLLECAGSMGDVPMADGIWLQMSDDGMEPSVECYNHYMEAKAWYNAHFVGENHHIASTAHTYRKRGYNSRSRGYSGYSTGAGGTRDQAHRLLKEMMDKGLEPDTDTYSHLMVASSRERDIGAMIEILKDVWNVDTETLIQNPTEHSPVTRYPISSPLHPTFGLLHAVAHGFCANGEFSVALQLVDFISRKYDMHIPERTWHELFTWSFQIASRHYRADTKKEDRNNGSRLPTTTVLDVHSTMTSEAYNISPSMRTQDSLVKAKWYRQTWNQLLYDFRAGVDTFTKTLSKRDQLQDELDSLVPGNVTPDADKRVLLLTSVNMGQCEYLIPSLASDSHYWHTFHAFQTEHMRALWEAHYLKRWGRLLFCQRRWTCPYDWERRLVPDAIMEFKPYLPVPVRYRTTSGSVVFDPETVWTTRQERPEELSHLTPTPGKYASDKNLSNEGDGYAQPGSDVDIPESTLQPDPPDSEDDNWWSLDDPPSPVSA